MCPHNVDDESGPICQLVLEPRYQFGIEGLNVGEKIDILYWLHNAERGEMLQVSAHRVDGDKPRGVFSLRSPNRPNPIGLAKLTIVEVTDGKVIVRGLDCLTGTKLIDIKPSITQ
nr:TrmO family methyltransferase [Vibrio nigripulchritudo]